MIYKIQGNRVDFTLEVGTLDLQNKHVGAYDFTDCTDFVVSLVDGSREYLFESDVVDGKIVFGTSGNERCGTYDVVLTFIDALGDAKRTKVRDQIVIVDAIDDLGLSSAEIASAQANLSILVVESESGSSSGISLSDLNRILANYAKKSDVPTDYLSRSTADGIYQPKGNYLTQHQSLDAYLTKALASQTYQTKGDYLTQHQSLEAYLTKALASQTYQPKGDYLTQHQSLDAYLTKALASQTYQPKGTYLTSHQDISGKMDKEEVVSMTASTASISPNKFYKWGEVNSLVVTLDTPTDTTHVNHYHFRFAAGSATTLGVPASVIWQGGKEPPCTEGNVYEVSIVDDCASYMEFTPYDD